MRLKREENFWDTGQPGPAGPCAEWHYDRGPAYGPDAVGGTVDPGGDRYLEIWNLVFDQFLRGPGSGKDYPLIRELDQKAIDTGAGLERIAFLKQGVENFFEIDEVFPVIAKAQEISGRVYGTDAEDDVRLRVIADHVRSALMLIGDGVTPGNEGRGYVLRRLLRRAVRSMRLLGVTTTRSSRSSRPATRRCAPRIPSWTSSSITSRPWRSAEEQAFSRTLTQGTSIFDAAVATAKSAGRRQLGGAEAFALHDTYGFPIDLTLEMAAEQGLSVDEGAFRSLMQEQRDRARADAKSKKGGHGDFGAYQEVASADAFGLPRLRRAAGALSKVVAIIKDGVAVPAASVGESVEVILAETPFYPESGGQDADTGEIRGPNATLEVLDVQRPVKDVIVHSVRVGEGTIAVGDVVSAEVDPLNRRLASKAHSATHLIHSALHEVLGKQANQAGSYNKPGYMRLDFSWTQGVSSSRAQRDRGHRQPRDPRGTPRRHERSCRSTRPSRSARWRCSARSTATACASSRSADPFSRELCAGTHVDNSGQIGLLTVTAEGSVGSGARRIEALVGADAFSHLAAERVDRERADVVPQDPASRTDGRVRALVERLVAGGEGARRACVSRRCLARRPASPSAAQFVGGTRLVSRDRGRCLRSADDLRDACARRPMRDSATVARCGRARGGDLKAGPSVVVATNGPARDQGLRAGDLVKVGVHGAWWRRRRQARPRSRWRHRRRRRFPPRSARCTTCGGTWLG